MFPHMSRSGRYGESLNADGNWTGSFWTGMILLAYRYTGQEKYLAAARRYLPVYRERLEYGQKDHDLGFLYQLYAANLYRFDSNREALELTIGAAEELLKRFNGKGRFIRAWGAPDENDRRGVMIIDCMMNLPLLYTASSLSGDPRFAAAADSHAETTLRFNIRPDASVYHTYEFDPDTGEALGGYNEGGFCDESCWSRGQAWAIYGFALAGRHSGRRNFIEAAERLSDYFIRESPPDGGIPLWDFKLPDPAGALKDASAAAIAACGLLELAEQTTDVSPAARWRSHAAAVATTLRRECSATGDEAVEGLIRNCYAREPDMKQGQFYTVWGDYFYMELLMKLDSLDPQMWTYEV
ncbi:glycosyl hydrolase [Paenibacillus nasutitermitis]|uniref:Glycosyl hydrolase n=1 Tax=Paenibacillus nasutitermitis TaxID=1652958 RepID=A0A916Z919_9BACL|nr:glycosyl hydrolase [Paenibacillus nasutitermitis]